MNRGVEEAKADVNNCLTVCLTEKVPPGLAGNRYSKGYIYFQRSLQYIRIAGLLHIVTVIGCLCFFWFGHLSRDGASGQNGSNPIYFVLSAYGLGLIFFSQMDARSRFQNYKQAKDLLYENGFQARIINLFSISRCQRDAVRVAAHDLGMGCLMDSYLEARGYRWYHVLPGFVFSKPGLFLTRNYWQKTLFVETYHSRYFLW